MRTKSQASQLVYKQKKIGFKKKNSKQSFQMFEKTVFHKLILIIREISIKNRSIWARNSKLLFKTSVEFLKGFNVGNVTWKITLFSELCRFYIRNA